MNTVTETVLVVEAIALAVLLFALILSGFAVRDARRRTREFAQQHIKTTKLYELTRKDRQRALADREIAAMQLFGTKIRLARITEERDRARETAARLEEQLAYRDGLLGARTAHQVPGFEPAAPRSVPTITYDAPVEPTNTAEGA